MAEPKKKISIVQRLLSKITGTSKPAPKGFEMMPLASKQEQVDSDAKGLDSAYGPKWRREIRAGRDPILPGPGGRLPAAGAKSGMTQGGFSDPITDTVGNILSPPQSYATPATHWEVRSPFHKEEFWASQYDFRKARGEKLPPFDVWMDIQRETSRQ